ncbi:MAG: hypothetical protein JW863_20055 [Chitinispirillaceae bacterium]|nr:hypothetical protein [Chitinispirillaceae bacterium]
MMMKKHLFFIGLLLSLALYCVMRNGEIGSRNNPFDAGGAGWTIDSPTKVTVTIDSLWMDFDHDEMSGSKRVYLTVDDLNFPLDTVTADIRFNGSRFSLAPASAPFDTVFLLNRLDRSMGYPCSIYTTGTRTGLTMSVCTLFTTDQLPPLPPQPFITAGQDNLQISWQPVAGAQWYSVYYASLKTGPYQLLSTLLQPIEGSVTVIDTPSNGSRHYRFASHNESGTAFLHDTLSGHLYSGNLTPPAFTSVSTEYGDYILLSVNLSGTAVHHVELYRSIGDTLSFAFVDTFWSSYPSSLYSYYCDSVTTPDTCYYRMIAVDHDGRCSEPGPIAFGRLKQIGRPIGMNLSSFDTFITLNWNSVSGAARYRLYRSATSCSENMMLVNTVLGTVCNDTTPDSGEYYYVVTAVDTPGNESAPSQCVSGRIRILPPPSGLSVTDGIYVHSIVSSWMPVAGASGYIIERSTTTTDPVTTDLIDTVSDTSFTDGAPATSVYHYRVAAFNAIGKGLYTGKVAGKLAEPPELTTYQDPEYMYLYWKRHTGILRYYIYRSEDSLTFYLLDSTTSYQYYDTLDDFNRHYYRMTVLAADGMSTPGPVVAGGRLLSAPTGAVLTLYGEGVQITWNAVPGAEQYILYRSIYAGSYTRYKVLTDTIFTNSESMTREFCYCITAVVQGVESPPSLYVLGNGKVRTSAPLTPPSVWTIGNPDYIDIVWTHNSTSEIADAYFVYRSTSPTGVYVCIDTVWSSARDSVPDLSVYYYKVAGYNQAGTSPLTAPVSGCRILQAPLPPPQTVK